MTPENAGTAENAAALSTPQTPEKPTDKKAKPARAPKKKETDDLHLPVFVEFTYMVSILFLIFVSLTIMITSIVTGASLLNLLLRTGVGILVLGGLMTLISLQVSSGMLAASLAEKEEFEKSQSKESEQTAEAGDTLQAQA